MTPLDDDDLAMAFAIFALCFLLWLAESFVLGGVGGWIGSSIWFHDVNILPAQRGCSKVNYAPGCSHDIL